MAAVPDAAAAGNATAGAFDAPWLTGNGSVRVAGIRVGGMQSREAEDDWLVVRSDGSEGMDEAGSDDGKAGLEMD